MTDAGASVLLPDGLRDVLPPDAGHEAAIANRLLEAFSRSGYARVAPPLIEFEDTLLDGAARAIANATFRLMDPASQRMMGVRADMTLQVARIATTRLANAPRPLRLAYAGQVLRVRGSQLRPEREFLQAGVELIGAAEATADAEVIALAATALGQVGVADLSVDINLPTLAPGLFAALALDAATAARLRAALDRKDAAEVAACGGDAARLFGALIEATGPAGDALAALRALDLPQDAARECANLAAVIDRVRAALPDIALTVDPVESRGFEYHSGLSFTVFARGVRGEIGRGGRYRAGRNAEPATGFSLFLDSVLRAVPAPETPPRAFLPFGVTPQQAAALRAQGWIAVAALAAAEDSVAEARRLGCTHIYIAASDGGEGRVMALDQADTGRGK